MAQKVRIYDHEQSRPTKHVKIATNRGWSTYPIGIVRRSLIHEISLRFKFRIEVEAEYDEVTASTQIVANSYIYHCLQKHATAI